MYIEGILLVIPSNDFDSGEIEYIVVINATAPLANGRPYVT